MILPLFKIVQIRTTLKIVFSNLAAILNTECPIFCIGLEPFHCKVKEFPPNKLPPFRNLDHFLKCVHELETNFFG